MQTDTHIRVISHYHCYDCSRHTGMNFYNYESPCQMMVNPMPVTSLLHCSIWCSQSYKHGTIQLSSHDHNRNGTENRKHKNQS